jgi:hypothetical protein
MSANQRFQGWGIERSAFPKELINATHHFGGRLSADQGDRLLSLPCAGFSSFIIPRS